MGSCLQISGPKKTTFCFKNYKINFNKSTVLKTVFQIDFFFVVKNQIWLKVLCLM